METGNQPPKAPITEESTAKLDVLCELCQSLFQDTVCVHSTTLNCALRHGQYHHHITELRRSAADGCHLCNILLYQIDIDDWSFPDDFPKDNFTPWIMLCVDEGYRITGDNDGTSLGDGAGSPDVFRLSGKRNYLLLHRERPREQIGSIGSFSLECLETAEPDDFRTISSKTNSQESFKLMRSWITECLTNHKECSTIMERCGNHTPPTRLLDLTQMNSRSIVRLVETTSLTNKPSYMTLSHCWGNMKCLTLTYDNFDELKAGFSADRLPKTFREAVITATSLNCFYIW